MTRDGKSMGFWARLQRFFGGGRSRRLASLDARASTAGDDVRTLLHVGDAYRAVGELERATRMYWRAVHIYRRRADNHKALALLKRIVSIAGNDTSARSGLAECLEAMERRAEAAEAYRTAAMLAQTSGRPNAARQLWDRAEWLCPMPKVVVPVDVVIEAPVEAPVEAPAPVAVIAVVAAPADDLSPLPDIADWPSIPMLDPNVPVVVAADDAFPDIDLEPVIVATAAPRATSTELALDAERFLLAGDPADAVTVGATPSSVFDDDTNDYGPMILDELLHSELETQAAETSEPSAFSRPFAERSSDRSVSALRDNFAVG